MSGCHVKLSPVYAGKVMLHILFDRVVFDWIEEKHHTSKEAAEGHDISDDGKHTANIRKMRNLLLGIPTRYHQEKIRTFDKPPPNPQDDAPVFEKYQYSHAKQSLQHNINKYGSRVTNKAITTSTSASTTSTTKRRFLSPNFCLLR